VSHPTDRQKNLDLRTDISARELCPLYVFLIRGNGWSCFGNFDCEDYGMEKRKDAKKG